MTKKSVLQFTLFLAIALIGNRTSAQQTIIKLYDGPAPGSESWTQKETAYEYMSPIWKEKNVALFNVVDPTLTVFLPSSKKATGTAMIVCPGGGFSALSWDNEGLNVGKKLAEKVSLPLF